MIARPAAVELSDLLLIRRPPRHEVILIPCDCGALLLRQRSRGTFRQLHVDNDGTEYCSKRDKDNKYPMRQIAEQQYEQKQNKDDKSIDQHRLRSPTPSSARRRSAARSRI